MFGIDADWIELIAVATFETIYMTFVAGFFATVVGTFLGVILYITEPGNIKASLRFHVILSSIVNFGRSVPFVILLVIVIPITDFIVGTFIGTTAAIVPLAIAATPFVARLVQNSLFELPAGLVETAKAIGATNTQIIFKFMLPEAYPGIVNNITTMLISLVNFTAMAGTVGGGGLGYVGIQYGYQDYKPVVLFVVVVILVALVQIIQFVGQYVANRLNHR